MNRFQIISRVTLSLRIENFSILVIISIILLRDTGRNFQIMMFFYISKMMFYLNKRCVPFHLYLHCLLKNALDPDPFFFFLKKILTWRAIKKVNKIKESL